MLVFLPLILTGAALHAPHDSTHSIAAASLPGGGEMQVVVGLAQKPLVSLDRGLTWEVAQGDGLQTENCFVVEYHPEFPASGSGMFFIGTRTGVWSYDPITRIGERMDDGIGGAPRWFVDLDCPSSGTGPVVGLTTDGDVYSLDVVTLKWNLMLSAGTLFGKRGALAVSPTFFPGSPNPADGDILVSASGQLWRSTDGGLTWAVSSQFSTVATQPEDWLVTSIEFSTDYANDSTIVLGRGAGAPGGSATVDLGEIWHSVDSAANFQRVLQLDTMVSSLESAPTGPSGQAYWFAAGRQFPSVQGYFGEGILRSSDGGLTWDSGDTFQDFLLEDGPGKVTGSAEMFYEQDLRIMPDYATTGRISYVRQEGMWQSDDEGGHWWQIDAIAPIRFRDAESTFGPRGEKLVFGAGYGTGAVRFDRTRDRATPLPERTPMTYNKRVAVSPNFYKDGQLALAGNVLLWNWQDPQVLPANADDVTGWHFPAMANPLTGRNMSGYPRGVRYSPHFDSTGTTPGFDRTLFWFTAEGEVRRSEDNLTTGEALPLEQSGAITQPIHTMAIAPTYLANGTRTDAYAGTSNGVLYRLENERWTELTSYSTDLRKIEISPTWERPQNPELFIILKKAPFVLRIEDSPGNIIEESLRYNLRELEPTGLALHPDFANHRVVYISTYSSGIYRIDLNDALPTWTLVGTGLPSYECNDVTLSADFANDGLLYASTSHGIWEAEDSPISVWQDLTTRWTIDNTDEAVRFLSPLNPLNSAPTHTWPWQPMRDYQLPDGIDILGSDVRISHFDQDVAKVFVSDIQSADLLTFSGIGMGTWLFEAIEVDTGLVVASTTASMNQPGFEAAKVSLSFPGASGMIELRATSQIQSGETLLLDGFDVSR